MIAPNVPLVIVGIRASFAVLNEPIACPDCKRMAMFVVNRDGKTRCVHCDEKVGGAL